VRQHIVSTVQSLSVTSAQISAAPIARKRLHPSYEDVKWDGKSSLALSKVAVNSKWLFVSVSKPNCIAVFSLADLSKPPVGVLPITSTCFAAGGDSFAYYADDKSVLVTDTSPSRFADWKLPGIALKCPRAGNMVFSGSMLWTTQFIVGSDYRYIEFGTPDSSWPQRSWRSTGEICCAHSDDGVWVYRYIVKEKGYFADTAEVCLQTSYETTGAVAARPISRGPVAWDASSGLLYVSAVDRITIHDPLTAQCVGVITRPNSAEQFQMISGMALCSAGLIVADSGASKLFVLKL
jgi:hypothetical protein